MKSNRHIFNSIVQGNKQNTFDTYFKDVILNYMKTHIFYNTINDRY